MNIHCVLCRLIFHGYRKPIEYSNLWSLNPEDRSDFVGPEFEKEWEKELKKAGLVDVCVCVCVCV